MLILGSLKKLHGANLYFRQSVLVGVVNRKPSSPDNLTLEVDTVWLGRCVALLEDAGVTGLPDGFSEMLSLETVVQIVAMSLMSWVGAPDIDQSDWMDRHPGKLVISGVPEALARECADTAVLALSISMGPGGADPGGIVRERLNELRDLARKQLPPIQRGALAAACRKRGIGWRWISQTPAIFQLGEGSRQYRLDLSVSTGTSRLSTEIARDKFAASSMLARFGLPVSRQVVVSDGAEAWRAAQEIGLPVVVKPRKGNMGNGVSVYLTSEEQVRGAVRRARPISKEVIVETYLPGDDYRILVAGGRVIAVAKRMPAHVVGDGQSNIRELLDTENANPRRSKSYRTMLMTIVFDSESEQLLAARGYSLDSVPPDGDIVLLKSAANWTAGGTTFGYTDTIHPDNAEMVVRATEVIGLDIAGVDLLIPDISRSFREVGGGICEVNYRPSILVHISADEVGHRDVAGDMIDAVYRPPRHGRVPAMVVCVPSGGDELCIGVARELRETWGLRAACHTSQGLRLGGWPLSGGPGTPHDAFELAVCDPTVDAVVLAMDPRQILENGLGMSHADIAVIPVRDEDAQGPIGDVESIFRLAGATLFDSTDPAACARTLVEATAKS